MAEHPRTCILLDPVSMQYDFDRAHPKHSERLYALSDLLAQSSLWDPHQPYSRLNGRLASRKELLLIHSARYVDAVQRLSTSSASKSDEQTLRQLALEYGFSSGDTPALPGMHQIASSVVGGTLVALSAIMGLPEGRIAEEKDRPLHIFHPAGGLHHAWSDRASGFCISNDAAIAIAHLLRSSEAKIVHLDFDAHHGDGVQRAFYDDPRVLTISFHEAGRYLFPGSGDILELGKGSGRGYSVNIPLEPATNDDSYIELMESLLEPLITSFAPHVIITQHGCDTHAWDPLSHLHLSMRGLQAQARIAHKLAHTHCGGRWLALGGGGYDPYRVVPRAWSIVWAEMSGKTLPEKLPLDWVKHWRTEWKRYQGKNQEDLIVMGKGHLPIEFPGTFLDDKIFFTPSDRQTEIAHINRQTVGLLRFLLVPTSVRRAFSPVRTLANLFDLLHQKREQIPSRRKILETKKGKVFLRDFCPPSMVERLEADEGLCAFARVPEREHEMLLKIAESPDCALTLAHTSQGKIVGEVTIAPADEWWEGIENLYEVAIEVSTGWRSEGLGKHLLAFSLDLEPLEEMILFAVGLSWHWDLEGVNMSPYRYRQMIIRLFGTQGFKEQSTTEPNISMQPANVFLVRIGKRVPAHVVQRFYNRAMSPSGFLHG